jgi:hypothetical protein
MRTEPAALATNIGTLTTLGVSEGLPEALQQVVDAAKLLFEADGAGPWMVRLARVGPVAIMEMESDGAGGGGGGDE